MLARMLRHPITLIVATALAAHGMLLLNDGLYYDSWMLETHVRNGRYDIIFQWQLDHSRPLIGVYYVIAGYLFQPIFWHKFSVWLYLIINSWLTIKIAQSFGLLWRDCILIGIFSLVYPAYQAYIEHSANPQIACYTSFLLATWLVLRADIGRYRLLKLVVGAALFFISFSIESLISFYIGFLALYLAHSFIVSSKLSFRQRLINKLWILLGLAVLPLIYYALTRGLFPPQAHYTDYTQPKIQNLFVAYYWLSFINNSIINILIWSSGALTGLGILGSMFAYPVLSQFVNIQPSNTNARVSVTVAQMLGFGALLFFLGVLPYISGGRVLILHGNESRFSMLIGLPMAIMITALFKWGYERLPQYTHVLHILVVLLTSAFIAANVESYIGWQAKWAKDRSWMLNLKPIQNAPPISVFLLDDRWQWLDNERIGRYLLNDRRLDFNPMVQRTLNTDKYPIVAPVQADYTDFYKEAFFVGRYDPNGCRATLTIERNPAAAQMGQFGIARRYWYYRFFAPDQMNAFLRDLTVVTVTPISDPAATACKSPS
ncbi:MAG: hypothetical protein KIH69_013155 [Anaerolineae bacterium]|nr:hypothetical protein [Anaerolineae bacterium]